MAIHYANVTHQKCQYSDGRRRSPMIGPSYDADMPLTDNVTHRTIYRPHRDGTVVWHSEIVSEDKECPYTNSDIPLQTRMESLYNDVGTLLKKNDQQFRACVITALPNSFTKLQAIFCANAMAQSFAERFHRIVEYSIHYKNGNLHVHFGIPEWEWNKEEHKWGSKAKSYYVDKDGNPIIGHYIDENGMDLRVPLLEKNENNEYVQKRDKKGGRVWKRRKINFLNKNELKWLHNEIDHHINNELERVGSDERVARPNKEVREKLKNAGLTTQHIGPQSCRTRDNRFYEITKHNAKVKVFENALTIALERKKTTEQEISVLEKNNATITANLQKIEKHSKKINDSLKRMTDNSPVADYVINELKPTKIFVADAIASYNDFSSKKKKILTPLIRSLDTGITIAENKINSYSDKMQPAQINTARVHFWKNNIAMVKTLRKALSTYANKNFVENIKQIARNRWKGLQPWLRVNYIKNRCGDTDAMIYQQYLGLDNYDPNRKQTVPKPIEISDTPNWQLLARSTATSWEASVTGKDFLPPADLKFLSEIVSYESILTETVADDNMSIFANYKPSEPRVRYEKEIASITNERKQIHTDSSVAPYTENSSVAPYSWKPVLDSARWDYPYYQQLSASTKTLKSSLIKLTAQSAVANGIETTIPSAINKYEKRSNIFENDAMRFGIDISEYKSRQSHMRNVYRFLKENGLYPEKKATAIHILSASELPKAKSHLTKLQTARDDEMDKQIAKLVDILIFDYMKYKTDEQFRYIQEHHNDVGFQRPNIPTYDESIRELTELYRINPAQFVADSKQEQIDISRYEELSKQVAELQKSIEDTNRAISEQNKHQGKLKPQQKEPHIKSFTNEK